MGMRKCAVVVGFGAFFLTMALLLKVYAYPRLAVVPADLNSGQTLIDPHAAYLDVPTLSFKTGRLITKNVTVADQGASRDYGENVMVLDQWQYTTDGKGSIPPMSASAVRFAVDRHTGLPVQIPDASQNGKPLHVEGYTIKFPFNLTKGASYPYWDGTLGRAVQMRYAGTETIDGLLTYRYTVHLPPSRTGTMEVPGSVLGLGAKSASRSAVHTYANDRTIWADPMTGAFVKVSEHQREALVIPGHAPVQVLNTTSVMDDATVRRNADDYRSQGMQLRMLDAAPWITGGLGVLLLAVGAWLTLRDQRRGSSTPVADTLPLVASD